LKKQLLSTSAIALGVAMAAPASAQEWNVDVGGYFFGALGFSDISGSASNAGGQLAGNDYEGLQYNKDAEISFVPSIALDNGLTFGANIQFETDDGSDMDEVYMFIEGDTLGTIEVGSENSAGAKLMVGSPSVGGLPVNSGSISGFVPFSPSAPAAALSGTSPAAGSVSIVNSFVGAGYSRFTEVGGGLYGNNDIARINYFTPSFNGLRLGVAFAPGTDSGSDGNSGLVDTNNSTLSDIFDLGLRYDQSFGATDISLSARWGTGELDEAGINGLLAVAGITAADGVTPVVVEDDAETWGVGAQVGFNAFTFGAAYYENENGLTGGAFDEEGYQFGVTYDLAGPWMIGLEYLNGEGSHGAGRGEDEMEVIKLAASRNLGPGVDWAVSLLYTEIDAADAATGGLLNGTAGTDIEATTISTSISLSF